MVGEGGGGAMLLGADKMGAGPGPELLGMLRRGKERDPIESNQPGQRAERDVFSVLWCLALCRRAVGLRHPSYWLSGRVMLFISG